MVNLADVWATALTPDAYVEQMTLNQELFRERIGATLLNADEVAAFRRRPIRILAITEDFCGDSAQFLPPLIQLERTVDNVAMRFVLRDSQRELAGNYLRKDGYQAIPVIILMDADFNELGFLIERPGRVYDEFAAETRRFATEHPELEGINRTYDRMAEATRQAVRDNIDAFRGQNQERWTRWLLQDLSQLLDGEAGEQEKAADD